MNLFQTVIKQARMYYGRYFAMIIKLAIMIYIPLIILDYVLWNNPTVVRNIVQSFSIKFYQAVDLASLVVACLLFVLFYLAMMAMLISKNKEARVKNYYQRAFKMLPLFLCLIAQILIRTILFALLLIVPGILKAFWLSLSPVYYLRQDISLKESLLRSEKAIKAHWKDYLLTQILLLAIVFVFYNSLIGILGFIYDYLIISQFNIAATIFEYALMFGVILCFGMIISFYYCLYQEMRGRAVK